MKKILIIFVLSYIGFSLSAQSGQIDSINVGSKFSQDGLASGERFRAVWLKVNKAIKKINDIDSSGDLQTQLDTKPARDSVVMKYKLINGFYSIASTNSSTAEKAVANIICDGTSDEVQINAAITAGYNVKLLSGTFTTAAAITYAGNNVTISGAGTDRTIVQRVGTNAAFKTITVGGDGWTLKDFTIKNNTDSAYAGGSATAYGIYVDNKKNLNIEYLRITGCRPACILLNVGSEYISIDHVLFDHNWANVIESYEGGVNHVKVTNCNFFRCLYVPIISDWSNYSQDWLIEGCTFKHCGYRVKLGNIENARINNCLFDSVGLGVPAAANGSFSFNNARQSSISNVQVINGFGGGAIDGCSGIDITNLEFSHSLGAALSIKKDEYTDSISHDINIIGGHWLSSLTGGGAQMQVYVADSSYNINFNSCYISDLPYGIRFVTGCHDNSVIGCQFKNVVSCISHYGSSGGTNHDLRVQNNSFDVATIGINVEGGNDMMFTGNKFKSCTTPINISDATCVRTFLDGNDWYGCTNDPAATGATTPIWGVNVDKTGAAYTP